MNRRWRGRTALGSLLGHGDARISRWVALAQSVEWCLPGGVRAVSVNEDPDDLEEEQAEELRSVTALSQGMGPWTGEKA